MCRFCPFSSELSRYRRTRRNSFAANLPLPPAHRACISIYLSLSPTFAALNEEHTGTQLQSCRVASIGFRLKFSRPDKRPAGAFIHRYRARTSRATKSISSFFSGLLSCPPSLPLPPPWKITHGRMNVHRVRAVCAVLRLRCTSQICFTLARVSPRINPLAITGRARARAKRYKPLCSADMVPRYEPFCRQNRWYVAGSKPAF